MTIVNQKYQEAAIKCKINQIIFVHRLSHMDREEPDHQERENGEGREMEAQENSEDWQSEEEDELSDEMQMQMVDDHDQGESESGPIEIKKFNLNAVKGDANKALANLDTTIPFSQILKMPAPKKINKEVCAKIIKRGETIIECFDCRTDQTCIICMDCFKNGNHQGHRFAAKIGGGGCCDCGDPQAWSEKGFCKNHTGQFKDFQIDLKIVDGFSSTISGLMYIYFQMVITKDSKAQVYTAKLLTFLKDLNLDSPYFNKLTALSITRQLPAELSLNEEMDKRTILENVLTSKVSGKHFGKWFDIFISMFSYYPFKMAILKHYLQNYGSVVDGTKSSMSNALAISCQIVTSYKLIEQYSLQNKIGIGQRSKRPKSLKGLQNYYAMFCHDISALATLVPNAPYVYWKMHIESHEGLKNLFHYYKVVMKRVRFQEMTKSEAQICSTYLNFAQIQFHLAQAFTNIVKAVASDPKVMSKMILTLWGQCEKSWGENPESLCILRPLERCLTLALFAYFNYSLERNQGQKQKLIKQVLKISAQKFQAGCGMILNRMWKTLFLASRAQVEAGLGQTLYPYIYIYKIHSRLLAMVDILSIKMFLILMERKYVLTFESLIGLERNKINEEGYGKQKANYLISVMKTIKQIFTHFCPQIYISYSMNPECGLYEEEIKFLIINYFKQNGKEDRFNVSQQDLGVQLLQGILPPQCNVAERWIKKNCEINKAKKTYSIDKNVVEKEMKEIKIVGLNFDDFWINVSSKNPFVDARKSIFAVTQWNKELFELIWNQISLESLSESMETIFFQGNSESITTVLPFLCSFYLVAKENKLESMEKFKQIILRYVGKIPTEALSIYELSSHWEKSSQETEEADKKKKINEIKAKKLQKMKKKQNAFLSVGGEEMEEEKMPSKFLNMDSLEVMEEKSCCICKNELNNQSVYIVSMNVRDHERLLKLGSGMECLNFASCRHVFDLKCIQKMYKKASMVNSIVCPLCKAAGNMVMPASLNYDNKLAEEAANRIIELLKQLKNNANFYEEIIKSFYHYVLLCGINKKRTMEKRKEIYRILYGLLKKSIPEKEIQKLKQKFLAKEISAQFDSELLEKKGEQQRSAVSFFLRLLTNQNAEQVVQLQQVLMSDLNKKQSIQEPKIQRNKLTERNEMEKVKEQFWLFNITIFQILKSLRSIQINECQDLQSMQLKGYQLVKKCIQALIQESEKGEQNFQEQNFINIENLKILRKIPKSYSELGNAKRCTYCSQISVNIVMCLMCDWCGCQKCEEGFAKTHINEKHGEVGAVMLVSKAMAYYISNQKTILAGCLYEDQWQTNVTKSTNWNQFLLNESLYQEIGTRLKLDEIPTRSKRIQKQ